MSEYTVKTINGCKVIFGGIPLDDLTALMTAAPKGWFINTQASRHLGAAFVMGAQEDTATLMDLAPCDAIKAEVNRAESSGLSKSAQKWLISGERGISSDTIFTVLSGTERAKKQSFSHPHDPDDLRRCRLLLEQVPEFAARIGEMAAVSKEWAGLIGKWDLLCKTMDAECDWRNGKGSAPMTYAMMKECIGVKP